MLAVAGGLVGRIGKDTLTLQDSADYGAGVMHQKPELLCNWGGASWLRILYQTRDNQTASVGGRYWQDSGPHWAWWGARASARILAPRAAYGVDDGAPDQI